MQESRADDGGRNTGQLLQDSRDGGRDTGQLLQDSRDGDGGRNSCCKTLEMEDGTKRG